VTPAVVLEPVTEAMPEEAPAPSETVKRRVSTAI